jgi:hypothetical protein
MRNRLRNLAICALTIFAVTLFAGASDCSFLGPDACTAAKLPRRFFATPLAWIAFASSFILVSTSYSAVQEMPRFHGVLWAVVSGLFVYWLAFSVPMIDFRDSQLEISQLFTPALAVFGTWILGKILAWHSHLIDAR